MERALAAPSHDARARVHPRGDRVLRLQGAPGRVLRRPLRRPRGHDQGARRLSRQAVAGHQRGPASVGRPDRSRSPATRSAVPTDWASRASSSRSRTRRRTRSRSRSRCGRRREAGALAAAGGRARPRHAGRGACRPTPDGARRPRGGARRVDLMGGTYGRRAVVVCGQGQQRRRRVRGGAPPRARGACGSRCSPIETPDDLREPAAREPRAAAAEVGARACGARRRALLDRELGAGRRRGRRDLRHRVPRRARGAWADAIAALNARSRSPSWPWTSPRA